MNDKKKSLRIVVLGDSNVGKSNLITRFINGIYSNFYHKTYCKKLIFL